MMKRIMSFMMLCASLSFAGYSDGFITAGEYEYGVTWTSYAPPLIVDGGGADIIEVRNNGRLEVRTTSSPLGLDVGGIYDLYLANNGQLLYLGGETRVLGLTQNNTAVLKGGSINYIRTLRDATPENKNVFIYALPGWSWISNDPLEGIQGQWWSGLPFHIEFINDNMFGYDPVWMSVKVITPEPATLALLAFGGLLIRRRK